jgi:predicted HD phosphohydrolase
MTSFAQVTTLDGLFSILEADDAEHGLQCAYELAIARPDDVGLHIAGLLHDVAHCVVGSTEATHGVIAAAMVRPTLGSRIASLVELHVPAKRYLVTIDPRYSTQLSAESVHTLELQGGAMTPEETIEFEQTPHAMDAVALRQADDRAKQPGRRVLDLDHWRRVVDEFHWTHTAHRAR